MEGTKVKTGRVVWFSEAKGYGFIRPDGGPDDGTSDHYVHYTAIVSNAKRKSLVADQLVEFESNDGPKGLYATQVRIVNP